MLPVMLPLVSSITTTVIGWISFWKNTIDCSFSLSRISKSSFVRLGTRRFCASVTVANSDTSCVPDLNVGCWAPARTDRTDSVDAADATPSAFRDPIVTAYSNGCARASARLITGSSASAINL